MEKEEGKGEGLGRLAVERQGIGQGRLVIWRLVVKRFNFICSFLN